MILWKTAAQILTIQDENISDCKSHRSEWEKIATDVELSYKGIKFQQKNTRTGLFRNNPKQKVIINILKRQHRSIQNYFLNNEPSISARKKLDMDYADLENSKLLLKRDFVESDFYDEELDNITNYWLKRWIIYTLVTLNDKSECEVSASDSMDTYVDISAQRKKDIRFFIKTFTKNINEVKEIYKTGLVNSEEWLVEVNLDWDKIQKDRETTMSDEKKNIIKEPSDVDIILFREWRYLDYKDWNQILVKVLTIADKVINLTEYPDYDFLPVTYYSPINDPDNLYPDSWYAWVLQPEKEANIILDKFITIVKTWWRFLYVREWTRLSKWKSKLLNSIWVDVIEIWKAQELPREANLLSISQSQITLLTEMLKQAEEEWGMRQDIMWSSSMWADASWRAIEALQAGSKNNIWMAMTELNKFINRLAKIYFKMYQKWGAAELSFFDSKNDVKIKIDVQKLGTPRLHIEPRSAFDDITRKADWIRFLEYTKNFNPEAKISPEVIWEIFELKNDLVEKIIYDMRKEDNPDMKAAEASIALLLQWQRPAVSETDNHEVHMALLQKLLSGSWKEMPEELQKNIIDKYNTHKAYMGWDPADDEHRKE